MYIHTYILSYVHAQDRDVLLDSDRGGPIREIYAHRQLVASEIDTHSYGSVRTYTHINTHTHIYTGKGRVTQQDRGGPIREIDAHRQLVASEINTHSYRSEWERDDWLGTTDGETDTAYVTQESSSEACQVKRVCLFCIHCM